MNQQYQEYLKSDHWKELRRKKWKNYCGICGSTERIETHHLNYKNLYDVETADLRRLCHRCHFLAHDLMKQGKIRFKSTKPHGRFSTIKAAVKKELGITRKNMFFMYKKKPTRTAA